jgi:hypothetical protein
MSFKNYALKRAKNNGPLSLCWNYFALDMLKLPVFHTMRAKDHEHLEPRVTSQQQAE